MEYPFCTAGINITFLLLDLFEMKRGAQYSLSLSLALADSRTCAPLIPCLPLTTEEDWFPDFSTHPIFFHHEHALEELYCITFRLFDQKWNQMKVGYMGFQKVIDAVRDGVEELLKRGNVMGTPAIFDMLQVLLEDLEAFKPAEKYVSPHARSFLFLRRRIDSFLLAPRR